MKHFLQISTLLLSGVALCAVVANAYTDTDLTVTCGDASATAQPYDNGHCTEGMITFRGSSYPENVNIKVLSYPAGQLIDSADYSSTQGSLVFTQTLVPSGGYTILITKENDPDTVLANLTMYTDPLN